MTKLGRSIRGLAKHGNNMRAVVISCARETASVRLSGNGAVYRTLKVVGGPVSIGQEVQVDMSSDIPYIIAPSIAARVEDGPLYKQKPANKYMAPLPNTEGMILRWRGQVLMEVYPVTQPGLTEAFADCAEYDRVELPYCTLQADGTVPVNVTFHGNSVQGSQIWGTIGLSAGTTLRDMSILDEASSGSDGVVAVVGPNTGTAIIRDAYMEAFTCGSGTAYGLHTYVAANVTCYNIMARGESKSGIGYGVIET